MGSILEIASLILALVSSLFIYFNLRYIRLGKQTKQLEDLTNEITKQKTVSKNLSNDLDKLIIEYRKRRGDRLRTLRQDSESVRKDDK